MEYPSWQTLEELMTGDDNIAKDIATVYPGEISKWATLRHRNGRYCPMARGVLKFIIYMERDNKVFAANITSGEWKEEWKINRNN